MWLYAVLTRSASLTKELHVQVNTSGEESKYGVPPEQATELARHVARECSHLRLAGLMTIGQPDYSSRPENFEVPPAFNVLELASRDMQSEQILSRVRHASKRL